MHLSHLNYVYVTRQDGFFVSSSIHLRNAKIGVSNP